MGLLILGLVLFLGIHSAGMAAPAWRERTIARLGEVLEKHGEQDDPADTSEVES